MKATATLSAPSLLSLRAASRTAFSSSARRTWPWTSMRSGTVKRSARGTSGLGFSMVRSYWSERLSLAISRTSRKPSVASSAVRAPRRSITALVASVVPCTNTATSPKPFPASARISRTPSRTASSGRCGVVSSLRVSRFPPSSNTTSVNVPPMSTAMRKSLTTLNPAHILQEGRDRRPEPPALQFAGQDAYGRSVTATAPTLRATLYALLRYSDPTPGARQVRVVHLMVLGIGVFAVILLSIDELDGQVRQGLRIIIWTVTFIFLVEYLVRLWVAPETPRYEHESEAKARLRWAMSMPGLIGLLAILPAFMFFGGHAITGAAAASVFCILWIIMA